MMKPGQKLRELMADPKLLVMPGAYDALSARILQTSGFSAIFAGGYAAIGSMLAQPDMGQSNMRDYADHYSRICGAVDIPVFVDADTGFGGVHNVYQAVRAFEDAGVAGMFIQDQEFPNRCGYMPGKRLVSTEVMLAKVHAALDARRDPTFFIAARTDAAGVEGLDSAIERAQIYMEAGADMALTQGVDTPDAIRRVVTEVPGPFMAIVSQAAGDKAPHLHELSNIGVASVILPSLTLFAAAKAVSHVAGHVMRTGTTRGLETDVLPLADYYNLVRLAEFNSREEKYDNQAARMIQD
jgi:2,3-dimethylmalate lyase